ncbi:nitrate- and nitrite sensing domain-containing protein [Citrobacter sedlakii]|uniref:Nitrate- and nitrite sensing domain-containing protein n=1 Tax=Citrobacter sedlakii TaxID=67826 RepID=A0ABS0ZM87_9ENTR|nr:MULTISPECIES: nitrate regulatory protein NasR [Citrobacter]EKJ8217614.1 nitrate- and nitrite sensing domain-containing protein [Citrobacter sedlakii]MBJ8379918.1 nitrate- and nitrite sensing domain-containing protein [Citrobacter sedlakii]MBJ9890475.1 nitrate- and nitrite sensing domain-containing protein [Citrobacter sedlakii]MCK8145347.1 nitrate regulatory protein NasR [Citrobacter sedlakii]MDM2748875.1 nitrate regulatory protein NasR [Citrobacter sp. Cs237]
MMTNVETPGATQWFRYARQLENTQLRQLAQSGKLVSRISHLVHMLQCERGASNIWLCSQGTLYVAEIRASRALVDEEHRRLQHLLQDYLPTANSALCHRIASAVWCLEQLPALRDSVSGRNQPALQAMEQYSRLLRHLLSIVPELNDSIDHPHVAGGLVALYSFMQGKELVGQERALGAIGFTHGEFSPQMRQELVDRIDGQQLCFDTFLSLASPAVVHQFRQYGEAEGAVEQLRRHACTRQPDADNGTSALRWFTLQTQRLEQLRAIEEMLIAELMNAVERRLNQQECALPLESWLNDAAADTFSLRRDKQLLLVVRQQARQLEQLSGQLASLQDSLEERKVIDKAKSVLMNHQQLSEEQAWQTLRKMAMDKNQRMVDIARAVLTVKSLMQSAR